MTAIALGLIAALVGLWALLTATGAVSTDILPTVGSTAQAFGHIVSGSEGLHNLATTGLEVLGAFVISAPVAVALGYALGEIKRHNSPLGRALDNALSTLLATPKFTLLPILIVVLGAGYWEKVTYAMGDGMIVLLVGTAAGAYTVEGQVRTLAHSLRMSRWQFFRKVYLPGALPIIVESLRLCIILIIAATLLADMYISNSGIGYLISQWGSLYDLPSLFAGVALVGILAMIVSACFRAVEVRVSRWRVSGGKW